MGLARQIRRNAAAHALTEVRDAAKRQGVPWCKPCRLPAQDLYDTSYDFKQNNNLETLPARGHAWQCINCKTLWYRKKIPLHVTTEGVQPNESNRSTSDD